MTERRSDIPDRAGRAAPRRQGGGSGAQVDRDRPTLSDFRRRVDLFWSQPQTGELGRTLNQGRRKPRRLPPTSALRSRLRDTVAILESRSDQTEFRLQKGLTLRDGKLTSIWGDERPLPPDDRVLVVTTTTTVMDSDSLAVVTNVLVFEREA